MPVMAEPNGSSPVGAPGGSRLDITSFTQTERQQQGTSSPRSNEPLRPLTPPFEFRQKEASVPPWQPTKDGRTIKATTMPPIGVISLGIPETEENQVGRIFDSATGLGLPRNDNTVSSILAKKTTGNVGFTDLMRRVADGTASTQDLEVFSKEVNTITYGLIKTGQAVFPENTIFVRGLSVKNCAVEVHYLLSKAESQDANNPLALALSELAREEPRVEKLVNKIATGKCIAADAEILKKLMEGLKDDLDSRQMRPPVVPSAASVANKPLTDSGYGSTTDSVRLPNPAMHGHTKDDDARTTYSIETNEDTVNTRIYVEDLANDIYSKLQPFESSKDWSILSKSLPDLLKAFANHIGNAGTSQTNRDIMLFIHNQHLNIVSKLEDLVLQRADADTDHPRDDPDSKSMSLSDKMNMWLQERSAKDSDSHVWEKPTGVRDDDPNANPPFAPSLYNQIVLNSKGYDWFITSLKELLSLQWSGDNSSSKISEIRHGILDMLPTDNISMRRILAHRVVFQLSIEPFALQRHRWIQTSSKGRFSLPELMVLTTSSQGMQLTRVREYVHQTWPSFGRELLGLLEKATDSPGMPMNLCVLPDKTWLAISKHKSFLLVSLTGSAYSIAACGEELSWLAAAVRHVGNDCATYATPSIRKLDSTELEMLPSLEDQETPSYRVYEYPSPRGTVGIKIEVAESLAPSTQWQKSLWHRSFGHQFTPAIVQGYPTARRPEGCPGLELSFDVLFDAVKSWTVTAVYPSIQLRGNNVTLRLAGEVDGIFYWHEARALSSSPCLTQRFLRKPSANMSLLPTDSELRAGRHVICDCESHGENENDEMSSAADPSPSPSPSPSLSLQTGILSTSSDSVKINRQDKDQPGFSFFMEIFREAVQQYISQTTDNYTTDEEECSGPVVPRSHFDNFISKLRNIVQRCLFWAPTIRGADNRQQASGTPQAGLSTAKAPPASPSQQCARKRQRRDMEESDDDRGGLPPKKRLKPPPPRSLKKPRFLACPYWKLDHDKHWDCFLKKITTISYVKQHLSRRHTPAYYCQRCFTIFDNESVLDDHVVAGSCVRDPAVQLEGISNSQSKRLSQKSKGTVEQQWYGVWNILFPDRPNPSSIYVDADQSKDFALLREFSQNHGVAILHDHLRTSGRILRSDVSEQEVRETLLQALDSMFEYFRLGQGSNSDSPVSQQDTRSFNMSNPRETLADNASADSGVLLSSFGSSHGSHVGDMAFAPPYEQDNDLTSSFTHNVQFDASLLTAREGTINPFLVEQETNSDMDSDIWHDIEEVLKAPNLDGLMDKIVVNGAHSEI